MSALESAARTLEDASGLDPLADLARAQAHRFLVEPEAVDALLEGTWLGHRLHPVLAQLPMGAFAMSTLLDLVGGERHADAVDALTLVGIATALPTAVAGAHDLATTRGGETRVGVVHAATMDVTLVCFVAAHRARRKGRRRAGRFWALTGTAAAAGGAYLGGHLTYRLGVGVSRRGVLG